jgi:MFS family permease
MTSDTAAFSIVRARPVLCFWFARVATALASQMVSVAVGWQTYEITGSALALGLVGLAQFAPALLFLLFAGHAADRFNRRHVIRIAQIVEAAAMMLLLATTLTGTISREMIFIAVFVLGAGRAFEATGMQAMLPAMVPAAQLSRAVATVASGTQTAAIIGPALGGLFYILGPSVVYGACLALFLIAAVMISLIRLAFAAPPRESASLRTLFAGIDFVRRDPIILGAISLDLFAVIFGGAAALLPIFARDVFHVGPEGLGVMRSAPAVGAILMSLTLARWPLRGRVGHILYAAVAVFGVAAIAFGLATAFPVALVALAAMGAADMISVVIRLTVVQLETPDAMRGRVSAVNAFFIETSNRIGDFESGVTAALFGIVPSVLIGGFGTLIVVALWVWLFPALFRIDRMEKAR